MLGNASGSRARPGTFPSTMTAMSEATLMPTSKARQVGTLGPLVFVPILKQARWGGTRLGSRLGKDVALGQTCAESWEVADLVDDSSVVVGGPQDGRTLHDLVRDHNGEILGRHGGCTRFPLLCKFLDAADRLSVQVHPDDAYAARHGFRYGGKSEAWVIIEAAPGSRIFAGLRPGVDRCALRQAIQSGSVAECLDSLEVHPGDCFNIPAGTVHAIGEGIVLAEIQQTSDITYRLFDWNRTDSSGQPRPLHVEESLACVNFSAAAVRPETPVQLPGAGSRVEQLLRTPHFEIRRHFGPGRSLVEDDDRFHILMVIDGAPSVTDGGAPLELSPGRTVLLPARRDPATLVLPSGSIVLESCLPDDGRR